MQIRSPEQTIRPEKGFLNSIFRIRWRSREKLTFSQFSFLSIGTGIMRSNRPEGWLTGSAWVQRRCGERSSALLD